MFNSFFWANFFTAYTHKEVYFLISLKQIMHKFGKKSYFFINIKITLNATFFKDTKSLKLQQLILFKC